MMWKILPLATLCFSLSAAEMPEDWKPYHSVSKNAPAGTVRGTVTYDGKTVRITDPGARVETGIVRTIPCKPGQYVRITTNVKDLKSGTRKSMEISAYYIPWQKNRAGTTVIKDGENILVTGPAPEKNAKLQIFVYSNRPTACDVEVTIPKVEVSQTPFTK